MSKAIRQCLLACLGTLVLTGCGYSSTELYPAQYNSVSVPNFDNTSNTRGVEFDLREALVKEIEQRTPYKVVSSTGRGDTRLSGTVTSVQRELVSRDPSAGLPQEIEITIRVNFAWDDQRTGQTIRGYDGLSAEGQFIPNRTVGEFGEDGTRLAVQRLAQDIVTRMQEDRW